MALIVKIHKTIRDLNEDSFNAIFPNRIEGYQLFDVIEKSHLEGFEPFYITVDDDGRLVAAFPFYAMNFSMATSLRGPAKNFANRIKNILAEIINLKVVICGCPIVDQADVALPKENYQNILDSVLRQLDTFCAERKINIVVFKDLRKDSYGYIGDFLLSKGYFEIPTFPSSQLNLNFKNFDEYLASLSHATRKDLRRKLKKSNFDKMEFEVRDNIDGIEDHIYRLYLNTLNQSSVQFEVLGKEFFLNVARLMPGISKFFLYRIGGKIVAFNLLFIKDKICIDKYIGLDYSITDKNKLYFTTWAINIDWCIKNGITVYQTGQTDYDPKIRLGAKLIPLYIYARHQNTAANIILKLFSRLLKPDNFDPTLKRIKRNKKYEKVLLSN